jgi:hypothetical protein
MAKIRAKRKKVKKVGGILDKVKRARTAAKKKTAYRVIDKTLASATKREKPALKKAKKLIQQTYIGAVKKAAKKRASLHKDTKSHNVRISVVSGVNTYYIERLKTLNFDIFDTKDRIESLKFDFINAKTKQDKVFYRAAINEQKAKLKLIKHQIVLTKKNIK